MRRLADFLAAFAHWATVCTLTLMVVVTFLQVIFRYVLQNSLDWSEEGARYLFVWTCYLGLSYAMHSGSHLEVTIFRSRLSPTGQRYMCAFSMAVSAIFCGIAAWYGCDAVGKLWLTGQTTTALQYPTWLIWLCLPVGFGLAALQALIRCWMLLTGQVEAEDARAVDNLYAA